MVVVSRRTMVGGIAAAAMIQGRALAQESSPVTVFEAASILTMEPSLPTGRFVAVSNGLILGVANRLADLDPWLSGKAVNLDHRFRGRVLMPGLIDPHVHPMQAAVMLNIPFVAPEDWKLPSGLSKRARTPEEYRKRLLEELAKSPASPFITWGHHELFHGPMNRRVLDGVAPERAVVVWQRSFHEVILNTAALKLWGLDTRATFDAAIAAQKALPDHASFEDGVFSETALQVALARLRPLILSTDQIRSGMTALQRMMLTSGVTTISDMATGIFAGFQVEAEMIRSYFEQPENPSRVMLMPIATEIMPVADLDTWFNDLRTRYSSPHIRIDRRVKFFADGAFFAQNMMMNAPGYTDGHIGKWLTEPELLDKQMHRFWEAGFDFHIHVNGDQGLDVVLDHIDMLPPRPQQTITLEHLGYSTEAQNRRIARMGLLVSAQPNYVRVLGDVYGKVGLGPGRAEVMSRLGSLERKGVPLGLHSDFNMAPIDPFYLAWVAANRQTIEGNVKAPEERLSIGKALRAITIEAAQVIGMDALVGSIAPGKQADFVVLDRSPLDKGSAGLDKMNVRGVIFEGRYVEA